MMAIRSASARFLTGLGVVASAAILAFATVAPAEAQRRSQQNSSEEQDPSENRQMSSAIGEQVLRANEAVSEERYQEAVTILNAVMNREMTAYERSVVLRIRGVSHYNLDNTSRAIDDWLAALATNALVRDEIVALRTNVGQVMLISDRIDEGIRQLEMALSAGAELTVSLARMMAQAYVQAERFQDGLRYAEFMYNNQSSRSEGDYNLMQYYYSQLGRTQDELRVVRSMLNSFPASRRSWQNLRALYARLDQEENAFETAKLMYLNGLLQDQSEIVGMVAYYSNFNNPYRGARILEREINAGRVEASERFLNLLSNMWRQADEFERSIAPLEQLYRLRPTGETALKIAEARFQMRQWAQAEQTLTQALDRGGLSSAETGRAWELLGSVRFQQERIQPALAAYREAARFPTSRSNANGWIRFINSQIQGAEMRAVQREQVLIDECRLTLESERRSIVLTGAVDDDGRVRFSDIPSRCEPYFNLFGEQIREAGMSDEEAAEAQRERDARQEAAASGQG
ncbi:tetratricopeptide repeat protein [Alkalicaulis satelles]|uniref:Tetratricopeptide repeat protein n=1 Tax=Alkalicaulis satelles TaxID=2609175 RepID=A0A5M6Z8M1_9PROT|nr:tetratricopeptide repeat protein [Alkalicaulis satelles]KAA5800992.1 tetratricopeptide repeat protein [Alkalicaulis satelles]